jgi:hypothetical protein
MGTGIHVAGVFLTAQLHQLVTMQVWVVSLILAEVEASLHHSYLQHEQQTAVAMLARMMP